MSLKKSVGNMYPWVTHTHSHLGGECPHKCVYCYVKSFPFAPEKFRGPLRLIEKELSVPYGTGKTIFIEPCNDLFAEDVDGEHIHRIIHHCGQWPDNRYVFQSKNPSRMVEFSPYLPKNSLLGCTIETNRPLVGITEAPDPESRFRAMCELEIRPSFITVEPIMDFDVDVLASWIDQIRPEFLNLGADSKNHNLPEPTVEKIMKFTEKLKEYGIELREKHNLRRLKAA